jgi:hypothetical protein
MHNSGRGSVSLSQASTALGIVLQCPGWWHSGKDGRTGPEVMEEMRSTGPTSRRRPGRAWGRWPYLFRGFHRPLSRGASWGWYGSGRHSVTELTPAFPHSSCTVPGMAAQGGLVDREHIKWKPTPPCKLWKLPSEPHDVDPREDLWKVGGVMCKTHERWEG